MSDKPDYKDTVFLPKTDFPMKAGLAAKEPAILARWAQEDLYGQLRQARAGAERFILHDGPPYANGDLHMGHAMNKILKDIVVRSASLRGYDAPYIPGWDCHGLPIEWKVEEAYRKKKLQQGRGPHRRVPRRMPRLCREVGGGAARAVPAPRRDGRVGRSLPHHALRERSRDRRRTPQDRAVRPALPRRQAGHVEPGRKDRARRGEVEYEDITSTQIDVAVRDRGKPDPGAGRRPCGDLDDHAVDDPGQPGDRYGPEVD
jgi:isoleucyl-tRNA synthetase